MKRRQAKKVLKRWPAQRHATLRRAVRVYSKEPCWDFESKLPVVRRWIRRWRGPGAYQLTQWLLRLSQAREISRLHSREPREDVAEMWAGAHRTEQLFLSCRWKRAWVGVATTITLSDATGRAVTFPLSSVVTTYGP